MRAPSNHTLSREHSLSEIPDIVIWYSEMNFVMSMLPIGLPAFISENIKKMPDEQNLFNIDRENLWVHS